MGRRTIPAISLLGSMILLPACGSSPPPAPSQAHEPVAEPVAEPAAEPELEPSLQVFQLQHVDATETAEIVNELIDAGSGRASECRVVADPRLNAIVVYGDEDQRGRICTLLVELDKSSRR